MKTPDRKKKPTYPECGHKIETDDTPCPRCTAKPGENCPDCGRATLESGGETAVAYCSACYSVFGQKTLPPPKPGDCCVGHTSAIETWFVRDLRFDGKDVVRKAMLFRFMPPVGGTARLALDNNKGALLLQFNDYPNGAECYICEPEELAFYCTDTLDNVETWRAFYKERWRINPATDKREPFRPCFLCRVERVPYDAEEQALYERREAHRKNHQQAIEAEKKTAAESRERAELDRQFKEATIRREKRVEAESKADMPVRGATAPGEIWFDVDGEHRRLYAIRKNEVGRLCFFMDRADVLELTGWPKSLPDTLTPADVQTVARMGGQTKGVYLILTRGGGSWGCYILRRKYRDIERSLIPPESEEAAPAKVEPETKQEWPDMMTIQEAALFCECTERTIRNRLNKVNNDGTPLLAGVIGIGRLKRIPRTSLVHYRRSPSATKKTPRKRSARKPVKRKS